MSATRERDSVAHRSGEQMTGHVPTPPTLADRIVETLFDGREPSGSDRILFPGVGTGPFVTAVRRYCESRDRSFPDAVGLDTDPELLAAARDAHAEYVDLRERDFLGDCSDLGTFDYVVGNPPYVPIERLSEGEKTRYRRRFETASGRFDLFVLFFEQALDRLNDGPDSGDVFVCPYDEDGRLPPEPELGVFGDWASLRRDRLEDRSCVEKNDRPWYGWHENPPMEDVLRPKILCQDITDDPTFWLDADGDVLPRHSVYYIVPEDPDDLDALHDHLNSPEAHAWFEANCQRAANGYLRLQSRVVKKLPVPDDVVGEPVDDPHQTTLGERTHM